MMNKSIRPSLFFYNWSVELKQLLGIISCWLEIDVFTLISLETAVILENKKLCYEHIECLLLLFAPFYFLGMTEAVSNVVALIKSWRTEENFSKSRRSS